MSGKSAKKARREGLKPAVKPEKEPTTIYLSKPERTAKRIAENAAERRRQERLERIAGAASKLASKGGQS